MTCRVLCLLASESNVVCDRYSRLKDWNQKRVVWDAFWWYATEPRISERLSRWCKGVTGGSIGSPDVHYLGGPINR